MPVTPRDSDVLLVGPGVRSGGLMDFRTLLRRSLFVVGFVGVLTVHSSQNGLTRDLIYFSQYIDEMITVQFFQNRRRLGRRQIFDQTGGLGVRDILNDLSSILRVEKAK